MNEIRPYEAIEKPTGPCQRLIFRWAWLVGFMIGLISPSRMMAQGHFITQKQALEELEIIRHAIVNYHPAPFRYLSEDQWHARYHEVRATMEAADAINQFTLLTLVSPLITLMRDEHSDLLPGEDLWKAWQANHRFFPFEVAITAEQSLIIRHALDAAIDPGWVGKKVVSINGNTTADIIEALKLCGGTSASSDFSGTLYHAFNFDNFSRLYYMCVDQSESFEVLFETGETAHFQGYLTSGTLTSMYRYNPENHPELRFSDDSSFAYLRVSAFWPPAFKSNLKQVLQETDRYFRQMATSRVTKLVIDVRGNRGGTPFFSTYLAGYFFEQPFSPFQKITAKRQATEDFSKQFKGVRKPSVDTSTDVVTLPKRLKGFNTNHDESLIFEGEVIVLIDAGTGSAASIFAGLMTQVAGVTFLGQETLGDGAQTTGGQFQVFELPYSKFELTLPLLLFHHGSNPRYYGVKADSPIMDDSLIPGNQP